MRTSVVRRCALPFPFIRWRGNVFRSDRPPDRGTRAARGVDGSDPPRRRLGTGSGPGWLAHPRPPSGSLPHHQSLAGRPVQRRFEAADHSFADRLAVGLLGVAARGGDAPVTCSPRPSRTGSLAGRDPAAAERMGLSGPILPGADRGMAERGVPPIHIQGARIGIGAPLAAAEPEAGQ